MRNTDLGELAQRADEETLTELEGIGDGIARLITEALAGGYPSYLEKIEAENAGADHRGRGRVPRRPAQRLPLHSRWSDGGYEIEQMAAAAIDLGHEYMVLTDHSARLIIAHGLDEQRLARQLDEVARINADIAAAGHDFRILTGMEVDINEDGTLDLADSMLARLDVVVASVHSKLRMERTAMTERMVLAVSSPHVDILGHCTGRLIGKRPESQFDADFVFAACAQFGTAVEINSRPERLDPPRLMQVALDYDCWFSIDSDAHATVNSNGNRTVATGPLMSVPIDKIINTMPADELVAWAAA